MKTIKYILAVAILTFARTNQAGEFNKVKGIETDLKRDVLVSVTEHVLGEYAYINLKMLNESRGGVYTLVKKENDGQVVLIDSKDIAVNVINKPILYSFKVPELAKNDCEYTLYRISREVEVVQSWCYCSDNLAFYKDEVNYMTENIK